MASPLGDDATTASLDSPQHNDIDIPKAPAAVSWTNDNGQHRFLSHSPLNHDHVTFDIQFDTKSNTALFKLVANVSLKGKRNKSNVFLFIYPECIQTLGLEDDDNRPTSMSDKLGTSTYSLHFNLATPPALVVPSDGCVPKNQATRSILELLQDLAWKTSFDIAFPCRTLPKDRLIALCEKVSLSGHVRTMSRASTITKLYGGKGGRVIENGEMLESESMTAGGLSRHDTKTAPPVLDGKRLQNEDSRDQKSETNQSSVAESPPSYDELDAGHSPPGYPQPVKKRRRLGSDVEVRVDKENLRLEDICRQGFNEIGRRLNKIEHCLGGLGSRIERVEERMFAIESRLSEPRSSEQKSLESMDLAGRVSGVEERVVEVEQKLDAGLSELARDVEHQIYDVRHEFDNMISVRVEDETGVAQSELEDFVKDELRNVAEEIEETVREKLREALS